MGADALQSGNLLGALGLDKFNIGMGTIASVFIWIFVSIFFVGIICGIVIFIYLRKSYNQKVWIFSLIGNVPSFKSQDTGKFFRVGFAGDKLFKLRKLKKVLPPPTIQMGIRLWWYWEREDGELINFSLKDLDKEFKKVGAYYVDTDMRMQRLGIQKNLEQRFKKESWFSKYGSTIAGVIFVILVTVSLVVLFSKLVDVSTSIDHMATSVGNMAEKVEEFYHKKVGESPSALIDSGESGLIPALIFLLYLYKNESKRFKGKVR